MLDIDRRVEKTEPVQYPANFREVAAELDYRSGIAGGESGRDLVLFERRRNNREGVIPRDQRDFRGGGRGGQGRDARDDLDPVSAGKAGEYIYKAAIE